VRTLWDSDAPKELLARLGRLTPDTKARWGKFTCPDMVAHLNDSMRMVLGDITPAPKKIPIRFFPLKQLVIYVLPFPKGVPTAPELIARCGRAAWADELKVFPELMARLATLPSDARCPPHPAFGTMNRRSWGVLTYRHLSHHFAQFGV
jgi:hypothetical protein